LQALLKALVAHQPVLLLNVTAKPEFYEFELTIILQ